MRSTKTIFSLVAALILISAACTNGPQAPALNAQSSSVAASTPVTAAKIPKLEKQTLAAADAAEPAIAALSSGEVYLGYVEHHGKDGADVLVQRLMSDGSPDGTPVRVNETPNSAKSWKGDPPTIALGGNGSIYVGWTRRYEDERSRGTDLMLSVSTDAGRSFAPAVKVNDDTKPASHGMHSLAVESSGRVIMAWLDERNVSNSPHQMKTTGAAPHEAAEPNSEVFTAISSDGGKTFSPNKRIAAEVCPCCKTSLLAAHDGTVYASWRQVLEGDHRHIAVASSKDGGETFGQGVLVSDDKWQLSSCPVSGPSLRSTAAGSLDVIWFTAGTAGEPGIYLSSSRDKGATFGPRSLVGKMAKSGTPVFAHEALVFNEGGEGLALGPIPASQSGSAETGLVLNIANASGPATAYIGEMTIIAFTRRDGDTSQIWTAAVRR